MLKISITFLLTNVLFLLPASQSAFAEWFQEAKYECSDPLSIGTFISEKKWFTHSYQINYSPHNVGNIYATIAKSTFQDHVDQSQENNKTQSISLSKDDAQAIKNILKIRAPNLSVPLIVQLFPTILSSYVLSTTKSNVVGGLFAYLFDNINDRKISAVTINELIAEGGTISDIVITKKIDNRAILINYIVYSVNVGKEIRYIMMKSCTYPTKIEITKFVTTGPVNNKEIIKGTDGKWYIFDLKTKKQQQGNMIQTSEDDDYMYFDDNGSSQWFNKFRISKNGGPFETLDDGKWVNFYLTTEAF